jgi:hypothetical protein
MANRKPAYETRIILFLDFLGFKEIVERTEADRDYLHNLLDAIDILHQIGRNDAELSTSQRIGAKQERFRDGEVDRFRRFQINDHLEFRRLLDWQVAGFRALENLHVPRPD